MATKKVKKAAVAVLEEAEKQAVATKTAKTKKAAAAKSKTAAVVKSEAPKAKAYVIIDHPLNGETISGLHYAIRIGASEGNVEISFNDGEWIACRPSAGYWWFDWGYFSPGSYKISARLRDGEKTLKKSEIRKVTVI